MKHQLLKIKILEYVTNISYLIIITNNIRTWHGNKKNNIEISVLNLTQ